MAKNPETGHVKLVANLEQLILFCNKYGAKYNPSDPSIQLPALAALLVNIRASLATVNISATIYSNAVNSRALAFAPVPKLVGKISAVVKTTVPKDETTK